jgi:hypothetical protein
MDLNAHTTPDRLERYAFLWSLARMAIAVLSLFIGAVPIVLRILPGLYSLVSLAWLISGLASLYLIYRWHTGGQTVFGGTETKDVVAFWIMVVTGINLGITGLGNNIGMGLAYSTFGLSLAGIIFKITAVAYAAVAYYLWKRWKESGERLFGAKAAPEHATNFNI